MNDIVTEDILKVKESIIEALEKENIKLHKKHENLEDRLFDLEKASNKQDQYMRRKNLEIHGISVNVKDGELEQKFIDIFSHLNINISKPAIENCHQFGTFNKIVRFVNHKVSKNALKKNFEVSRLVDNSKLAFKKREKADY